MPNHDSLHLAKHAHRSLRRRIHAVLRMAHRCLGMRNKRLGIGALGKGTCSAIMLSGAALSGLLGASSAQAGSGIFINDGTDSGCSYVNDGGGNYGGALSGNVSGGSNSYFGGHSSAANCTTTDATTQTNRVLFYGPSSGNGSTSLSLGGTLAVNSGRIFLGGANSNNMAIGNTNTNASGGAGSAGSSAIAIGPDANAVAGTAGSAIAFGGGAFAKSNTNAGDTLAFGAGAQSTGQDSVAIGAQSIANNVDTIAIGGQGSLGGTTTSSGVGAVSIGLGAQATANAAYAMGYGVRATGENAIAVGRSSNALAQNAMAFGVSSNASGVDAIAMGGNSLATSTNAIAFGVSSKANGVNAVAFGGGSIANAANAIAFGQSANAAQANAIAFGASAVANGNSAIAFGLAANANAANATAIGTNSKAAGANGVAVGLNSVSGATGQNVAIGVGANANAATSAGGAVAIGLGQKAIGDGAVAIGDPNVANGTGAVALGANNTAAGNTAGTLAANGVVAIGNGNNAIGQGSIALGNNSMALVAGSLAFGDGANANAQSAIAIGAGAKVTGAAGVAIGQSANAVGANDMALGTNATANGGGALAPATAFGNKSTANGSATTAFGTLANATGTNSAAFGYGAQANGTDSLAFGTSANATGTRATALGTFAVAGADQTTALGWGATASAIAGTAVGYNAIATNANDVALGSNSTTAAVVNTPSGTINGTSYNYAGNAANSTVSVGSSGKERTITNVAAGRISGTSTDAVNGSQLFATNQAVNAIGTSVTTIGSNVNNLGNSAASTIGGGTTFNTATGTLSGFSQNINPVSNTGAVGAATAQTTVAGALTQLNTNTSNLANVAVKYDAPGGNKITLGATGGVGAPVGGVTITNLANGAVTAASTDGVNGSQLFAVQQTANKGWNANTAAVAGSTGTVSGSALTNIAPGGTVTYQAGNNIAITQTGSTIAIATSMTPTFTSVTTGNSTLNTTGLTITGGPSVTTAGINAASKAITNVANGTNATDAVNLSQLNTVSTSVTNLGNNVNNLGNSTASTIGGGTTFNTATGTLSGFSQGVKAVDAKGNAAAAATNFTTVGGALTQLDANTTNLANAAVKYDDPAVKNKITLGNAGTPVTIGNLANGVAANDAVNVSQLQAVGNNANAGWNLSTGGNTAGKSNIGPGGTVDLSNTDGNVVIAHSGPNATFNLASNLAIASSITVGNSKLDTTGLTITGGPSVTTAGINAASKAITNVAAGTNATDAVNLGQLNTVSTSVTNLGNNVNNLGNSTASNLGGGSTYNPATGTVSAPSYNIGGATYNNVGNAFNAVNTSVTALQTDALQWNKTLGAYDASHGSGSPQKITNVANGAVTSTSTDVVNGQQLFDVQQTANKGWNANTSAVAGSTGTVSGSASTKIAPGDTVTYQAGNNIAITQTGNAIAIATSMTPTFTSVTAGGNKLDATGLTVGATTVTNSGLTIAGGPSVTTAGIDAASKAITNVAAGTNATDAVNLSQLNTVSTSVTNLGNNVNNLGNSSASTIGSGTKYDPATGTLSGFSQAVTAVDNKGNAAGAPTSYTTVGGALTQLDTNTTNLANAAVKYDDPATKSKITLGGIGGTTIGNLANGIAANDAVNVSQLQAVGNNANAGWNLSTNGATGAKSNVGPGGTVDLSNTDGNIIIAHNGPNATFDLASNLKIASSLSVGAVTINTSSVVVGASKLDATGLTINGGPSVTTAGLDAGGKKVTNVANGDVTATSTDAINGSQLFGVVSNATANAVQYDDATKTKITLGGAGATQPTQITNLANGAVTAGSTDAVNGSQLYDVQQTANKGWNLTANGADSSNVAPGGTVDLNNTDGNLAITKTGNAVTFNLSKDVTVDSVTAGNSKLDTNGLTITGGPSVTSDGINAASKAITNVADGTNATDAVNLGQLNNVSTSVTNLGNNVNNLGNSTASTLGGGTTYDPNTGTLTGFNQNITAVDGKGNAAGAPTKYTTVSNALTQLDTNTTNLANAAVKYDDPASKTKITLGGIGAGDLTLITNLAKGNISAASTDAVNGSQLFGASNSVANALGGGSTVNPDGTVSAPNYVVGGNTYNNVGNALGAVDTSVTALQTDALQWNKTLGAYDASHGSGSPQKISNVANGVAANDAVNVSQLQAVGNNANAGWNLSTGGDTAGKSNVGPGGTVDLSNTDGNIVIAHNGPNATFDLAKSITLDSVTAGGNTLDATGLTVGGTTVTTTGLTIAGGPSVTTAGIDAASQKITNVADGSDPNDAVNFSQLNTVATSVTNLGNNINNLGNTTVSTIGGGATYDPTTGKIANFSQNITAIDGKGNVGATTPQTTVAGALTQLDANTTNLANAAVKYDDPAVKDRITLGNTGTPVTIGNVANGVAANDAVNVSQLDAVSQTANKGWNLSTNNGTTTSNVAPGGTVDLNNTDKNVVITQAGSNATFNLASDVKIANSLSVGAVTIDTSSVVVGASKLDAAGLTITGGPSVTTAGIDAGGKTITNAANGAVTSTSTDVVNGSQLFAMGSNVSNLGNSTASTIGGGSTYDPNTGTLSGFSQNVTGVDANGNAAAAATKYTTVAGALTQLDTNTTNLANAAVKYDDPAVKDRITLGNTGTPVTIGNVANGVAANDAVNVSQLDAVSQTANKGWNLSTNKGTTTSKVAPGDTVDLSNTDGNVVIGQSGPNATFDLASNVKIANSLSVGAVTIDTSSVVVGASKLDAAGLTINGGPSVTTAGIDAGSKAITNVAAGTNATDAVNVGQLQTVSNTANNLGNSVASNLGGGSSYDPTTGTVSAPSYNIGGATYNNVGNAFNAVNTSVTALQTDALQWNSTLGAYDASHGSGSPQTITNVANGDVSATSTDAINGQQLYDVQQTANKGWNLSANGANSSNVAPGDTVDLNNTDGNIAITKSGNAVTFNLADDVTIVNSLTIGAAKIDTTGLVITGGPSVTAAGIDAGGKKVINVANGDVSSTSTDAVNGSQIFSLGNSVASGLGGGSSFDPSNGTVITSLNYGGSTFTSVQSVLDKIGGAINGGGIKYFHANSTGPDSIASGQDSVGIGPGSVASGDYSLAAGKDAKASAESSVAVGNGAEASGSDSIATGTQAKASGTGSIAMGSGSEATADGATAIGANSSATTTNSTAIGNGAQASANNGDVALGAGSVTSKVVNTSGTTINDTPYNFAGTNATSTVSVGSAGNERTVTNVAAGQISVTSTDAINGSQLYATNQAITAVGKDATTALTNVNNLGNSTATNLGGGAKYDPASGTVSAPTYNVYGSTANNVGDAITALQTKSPVQYSSPGSPTQPNNTQNPTQDLTLVGSNAAAPVGLHNVANGAVNAISTDAINGSQLYGSAQSVASALGGGTTVITSGDKAGQLTGTSYKLSTGTYNDVGSALTALDKRFDGIGGSIANLQSQVSNNLKEARQGISQAMAASALRYDDRPGKVSAAAGMAVYHRQVGLAAGLGWTSEDAKWRANIAGTYSAGGRKPDFGVMGGLSYTFN